MNPQHLAAILWLRWRMSLHQVRRAGAVSAVILVLMVVSAVVGAAGFFVLGLLGGIAASLNLSPDLLMLLWDGAAAAFLFFWMIGLVAELQRSEVLSLQKLLHLPISLGGAFAINYVGSLASLTIILMLPAMIGLSIGLVVAKGPAALLMFPAVVGFVFMVTALSYQFQGWLASLMVNKRRRRTIIVAATISLMVLSQLPNLMNTYFGWGRGRRDPLRARYEDGVKELERAVEAGEISQQQYASESQAALDKYKEESHRAHEAWKGRTFTIARHVNAVIPFGWLPYGALGCARGNPLPALLGALGMALIGAASLRRSYKTTLRLYSGHFTSAPGQRSTAPMTGVRVGATPAALKPGVPAGAAPKVAAPHVSRTELLERHLPGVSEHTAAVALVSFRSLTRAPEAKLALLTPIVLVVVYVTMSMGRIRPPAEMRPFLGLGAIGLVLLGLQQLVSNQFGLDRDGFRAFVLSPSPRRDILLGKNLSLAPIALTLGLILLAVAQVMYPARLDHLLATVAELGSTYLLFCIVANFVSILAPVPLASGSLRPAHPKAGVVLVQMAIMFVLPLLLALSVLPLGLELLLRHLGWLPAAVPLYLMLSFPELAAIVWVYGRVIGWQGRLLQAREQRILATVTTKVE